MAGGSFDNSAFGEGGGKLSSAPMTNPQAQVTEGLASSVFEIVASASIPSDNSSHKVRERDKTRERIKNEGRYS